MKIHRYCIAGILLLMLSILFFFTQTKHKNDSTELMHIISPKAGETITSPLIVTGHARGYWFFEATFPVVLTDWDGVIIAETYAQAQGEWMTEDFVPFTAELNFEKPAYGDAGSLILRKSNPSDLSENDDAREIPIRF